MNIAGYEIIFENNSKYYVEDLSSRDFTLESATPYKLVIGDYMIQENSWSKLIINLAKYLYSNYKKDIDDLYSYKVDWTKQNIYSNEKKINHGMIDDNLFINYNHTAIHSCWLIAKLLEFYSIDLSNVKFLIHRPSGAEPEEVKKEFKKAALDRFKGLLKNKFNKSDSAIENIINFIDTYMNNLLKQSSSAYTDLFLFENVSAYGNYKNRLIEYSNQKLTDEKIKKRILRYLEYLSDFYKI